MANTARIFCDSCAILDASLSEISHSASQYIRQIRNSVIIPEWRNQITVQKFDYVISSYQD